MENNANIDLAKNDGVTPLWIACQEGHENVVTLLLSHNADVNLAKSDGITPLWIACQKGHEHVHPHARLVYVTQGSGKLETGITPNCADQTFELQPGKLIVLTAGSWHRFSTGPRGLTVQPIHPITPTSGASANSHEMFHGTWSNVRDILKTIRRGANQ